MFLLQIAATAFLVNILAAKQLSRLAFKVQEVYVRSGAGDGSAAAELPSRSLLIFTSLVSVVSYWVAVVAGLSGVWSV